MLLENVQVSGGRTKITTEIQSFKLEVPVALITNKMTVSSGEPLTMTFIDLERVKTFGQSTAGYASANTSYPLFDGATMFLTTVFDKTPLGKIFMKTQSLLMLKHINLLKK